MSLATTIAAMTSSGCSAEQINAVVQAHEQERTQADQARKEKAAEKKRRQRAAVKLSSIVPETNGDGEGHVGTEGDTSPQVSPKDNIKPLSSPSPKSSLRSDLPARKAADEILEILAECLDRQTAADLVAHRKAKKSALTPGAARALVKSFRAFGDPEAAAQAMMAQGWTGFKPEWMQGNSQRAGPPTRTTGRETLTQIAMGNFYDEPQSSDPAPAQFAPCDANAADRKFDLDLSQSSATDTRGQILDFGQQRAGWR